MADSSFKDPCNKNLQTLLEGNDQIIKLQYKSVLAIVLETVGIKTPPVFKEDGCDGHCVKVIVILDLSIFNQSCTEVFQGSTFSSIEDAEADAVATALRYLKDKHMVNVLDYSTRLSLSASLLDEIAAATQGTELVQEVLDKFDEHLNKCKVFSQQVAATGEIYDELRDFLSSILSDFFNHAANLRYKLGTLQFETRIMHESVIAKRGHVLAKDFNHKVFISSKYILDYVLHFLGLDNAKYTNGPDGNGMVDAIVMFIIPYSNKRKYGGTIQITGKGNSSKNAEEDAAFQALQLFEQQFGLTIVDLNHRDRVAVDNDHNKIIGNLEKIVQVAKLSDQIWDKFTGMISSKINEYTAHSNALLEPDSHGLLVTYNTLVDQLNRIEELSVESVQSRWAMSAMMEEISSKSKSYKF